MKCNVAVHTSKLKTIVLKKSLLNDQDEWTRQMNGIAINEWMIEKID